MVIAYIKKADPKASFSNRQNHKPSSVLSRHLSTQPTPWNEAGSLFTLAGFPVYMVLLALVPPPSYVAIWRRELLPRGFTLTLREGGLFSVAAFLRLLPPVLSTAGLPFPVRTFLPFKFLMVISASLLALHILTTERLLRYS